ncbi:33534_t:CDS:1, partial [Racocetra persica]
PGTDLLGYVKSGAKICVQVKLVKHRKIGLNIRDKENNNSHVILAFKVQAVKKKKH